MGTRPNQPLQGNSQRNGPRSEHESAPGSLGWHTSAPTADSNTDTDSQSNTDANCNTDSESDSNAYTNTDSDTDTDTDTNAYTNTDTNAYTNTDSNSDSVSQRVFRCLGCDYKR
jgi:hypothetical protein